MRTLFLDSAVLLHAIGADHPLRQPCRDIVAAASRRDVTLHVSAEALQEYLFHRMRKTDRATAVAQARTVAELVVVHPLDRRVMDRALTLVETTTLRGRDAVHAATALLEGFDAIVTPDTDFADVLDLRRVHPSQALI